MKKSLFTLTFIIFGVSLMAQTNAQKSVLLQETNTEYLLQKSAELKNIAEQAKASAIQKAKENNWKVLFETNKQLIELMKLDELGNPLYYCTDNANAAISTSTNELHNGGSLGLSLDGTGMVAGEWDGGAVLSTHQEFNNTGSSRINQGDNPGSTHYHATHVAGTILAGGVQASAKGMAFNASLNAYDWNSDDSEMAAEAANGLLISNHSYGYVTGWYWDGFDWDWAGDPGISDQEDWRFGYYGSTAQSWDNIARNAPYYLIVKSSGNDRGDGPAGGAYPQDGPYDCISLNGNAKNILTVGAVADVSGGYSGNPNDVTMSSFSSWGPSDDGRIKPDICGNGVNLYSTMDGHNADYDGLSGTSMSSPNVTGSLLLLQEHYFEVNAAYMKSATLKALAIHTADECGPDSGPDYMFGWGLLNSETAAQVINDNNTASIITEETYNGTDLELTVTSTGIEPLTVTVVWTDPAGTPPGASLDPADIMLVNDIDLSITKDANTYLPYVLNKNNPSAAATTANNDVDNVEKVFISNPVAGNYTINISHEGSISGGSQDFSVIITGITSSSSTTPNATAAATPDCSTGTVIVSSDLSGSQTFYLTEDDGTVITSTTQNASSHSFTGQPDGVYRGKVEKDGQMSSLSAPVTLTNLSVPSQPSVMTGNPQVCTGTTEIYSVIDDPEVDSYSWTLPTGWNGNSTTNSISVNVGADDGDMIVTPNNACGAGPSQSMAVVVSNSGPSQPGDIVGDFTTCAAATETYSVPNDPAADIYTWTLPSGWTGSSTTNSISVTVGSAGGTISVMPSNLCGDGTAQTATVDVSASLPAQPDPITGSVLVCENATELYTTNLENDVEYTWLLPTGWSGASITNEITVTVGATSGNVSVVPANGCGVGPSQSLNVDVNTIPTQPDAITGEDEPCEGTSQTYSVSNQADATFNWTLPSGWTGTSSSNTITVTVGTTDGDISVTASNMCGESAAEVLAVQALATLGDPGSITGNDVICTGDEDISYSIAEMDDADSYTWTVPTNVAVVSGQGSASILVDVFDGANGGDITVQAENSCGLSSIATIEIDVLSIPAIPSEISGVDQVMETQTKNFEIDPVSDADSYEWILDPSWELNSGAGTTQVNITFPLGANAGTLSVSALNVCGESAASTKEIEIIPIGIENLNSNNTVSIYPNPSTGIIFVNLQKETKEIVSLKVLSLTGLQIQEEKMPAGMDQYQLDLSKVEAGSYILLLEGENYFEQFKLVIAK